MEKALYLTKEEIPVFKALPANVRGDWDKYVVEETNTSYESNDQLNARMNAVNLEKYPEFKKALENPAQADMGQILQSLPEDAIPAILFGLGACGIELMMQLRLTDAKTMDADAVGGLAELSRARHEILESNAAVFA